MKKAFSRAQARQVGLAGAKKRQRTIQNLIANVRASTGRTPTDDEIAALLATSAKRVRHHLNKTNGS